jgi:tetratricopeptide (TPR) repeat protein
MSTKRDPNQAPIIKRKKAGPLRCAPLLLLLWAAPAAAQAADFKAHHDLAVALYQAGRFRDSVPEFKAAYERDPKPGLLFNIAQAYRKSGQPREAIEYYDRYLSADRAIDDGTRRKVDAYLLEARNMLAALELELKQRLAEDKAAREVTQPEPPPAPMQPALLQQGPALPPAALAPPPPAPPPVPVYRRWWFWTALGGGAAVVAGVSAGAALGARSSSAPLAVPAGVPRVPITF